MTVVIATVLMEPNTDILRGNADLRPAVSCIQDCDLGPLEPTKIQKQQRARWQELEVTLVKRRPLYLFKDAFKIWFYFIKKMHL